MDKKLEEKISRAISDDPRTIGEINGLCMAKLGEYITYIENRRNVQHLQSMLDLLALFAWKEGLFNEIEMCSLIEPVKFVFPKGFDNRLATIHNKFLAKFKESAIKLNWKPEDNFISNIKKFGDLLGLIYSQEKNK